MENKALKQRLENLTQEQLIKYCEYLYLYHIYFCCIVPCSNIDPNKLTLVLRWSFIELKSREFHIVTIHKVTMNDWNILKCWICIILSVTWKLCCFVVIREIKNIVIIIIMLEVWYAQDLMHMYHIIFYCMSMQLCCQIESYYNNAIKIVWTILFSSSLVTRGQGFES